MRRTRTRGLRQLTALALTVVVGTGALTACGLESGGEVPLKVGPAGIAHVPELEGVPITVGGKDFTEQVILAYLLEFSLDAAGMKVRDLSSLAGSNSFRQALISGQIDTGIEYTGTAWISYLHNEKPIPDTTKQYEAVRDQDAREYDLTWLPPGKVDNTYSLALNSATAAATGVKTMSDYGRLVERDPQTARTCLETEFNVRRDGYPGMAAHYGFPATAAPISILQAGIIYQATAEGRQCAFGEVFTTDGRIKGLHLSVLEDDKQFFPHYSTAVVIRGELLRAHPQIAAATEPLMAVLDNDIMKDLNARVDIDGDDPATVARDFLVEHGLVTKG